MKKSIPLLILISLVFTANAQTPAQRDSAHRAYHLKRKGPKQNNPYAFADSAKTKKAPARPKKKTR
jgi:hypothetical protein